MRRQEGFTLIELLIVLAILGILVGIVAMSVGDLTDTAQTRGMASEKEVVQASIDTYNTQDVTVLGATAIVTRSTAAQILITDTTNAPFVKYLRRDSKYSYTWDAGGESLAVTE